MVAELGTRGLGGIGGELGGELEGIGGTGEGGADRVRKTIGEREETHITW